MGQRQNPLDGLIKVTYVKRPMLSQTLFSWAFRYYGEREFPGARSNRIIDMMLRSVGMPARDSIAWCSAFVNHVATEVGAEHTDKALARSWLGVGTHILPQDVVPGIIVVLRRGTSRWQGHVGFVARLDHRRRRVYVLGGNQSNRVCIKTYSTSRVLDYRQLGFANKIQGYQRGPDSLPKPK